MKSKNAPQTIKSRLAVWLLPLLFAASLFIIQNNMESYSQSLLSPNSSSLPYIPFVVNDSEQDTLLALIGLSLLVVYVLIIRKHTLRAVVLGGTGTAFLLLLTVLWITPNEDLKPINQVLQTLSTNDHTYYLVQQCHPHHGCSYTYVVLKCDSSGWMCHTYGSPFRRELKPGTCFVHPVSLAINPTTDAVELIADNEIRDFASRDYAGRPTISSLCSIGLLR